MPSSPTLRVGSVPYLVGRPLDLGLEDEPGIEFVKEVPAKLVEGLRSGRLDVALVSSIELFRRPGYRYLDRVAVAGEGFVASVQLFLRKPLAEIETVALDPSSRASATLVQVLLHERAGGPPQFIEVPLGADPRAAGTDSWLRIGDRALQEYHAADAPPVFNPSEEWVRRTGLPFVFAAWIVREGAPIEAHLGAFARAARRGEESLAQLAQQGSVEWKLPLDACLTYLQSECHYEPGARMAAALREFRERAAALDLCRAEFNPQPIPLPDLDLEPERGSRTASR